MRVCQKMCFHSREAARGEVKRINATRIYRSKKSGSSRDSAKSNGKTNVYYCSRCDAWHLTTIPANTSRIIKNRLKRNNK